MIIQHAEDGKRILSVQETEHDHKIKSIQTYINSLTVHNQTWKLNPAENKPDISLEDEEIINIGKKKVQESDENPLPGCTVELANDLKQGRYIVAPRNIRAGECILIEPPYVIGPGPTNYLVCLKCLSQVDCTFSCEECGFYFCSENCLTAEHNEECLELRCLGLSEKNYNQLIKNRNILRLKELLKLKEKAKLKNGERPAENSEDYLRMKALQKSLLTKIDTSKSRKDQILKNNLIVTTLRTLREMEIDEAKCAIVMSLQANIVPESHDESTVSPIINKIRPNADPEFLQRIAAIWDTNCFQVVLSSGNKVQGLFPLSSMMNHSCKANVQQSFSNSGSMIVRAIDDISEGEPLCLSYMDSLWPTRRRRKHLLETKHFECFCPRCKDPTELGSFMGSPLCQQCKSTLLPDEPLNFEIDWHCSNSSCKNITSKYQVSSFKYLMQRLYF